MHLDEQQIIEAWKLSLDEYEMHLESAQRILDSKGSDDSQLESLLSAWTPPAGMGEVPSCLQERAQELAEVTDRIMSELENRMVELRHHIVHLPRPPLHHSGRVTSLNFDSKA